ncbi:MAG TPA: CoA transferase [Candidatus Binatia bacterium]|nr:CoA transferase [Candidatus Binatia bacterium]
MGSGPFSGVRVLEWCTGVAGPLAGMLLADLGADVVKLERPPGDPERGTAAFQVLNRSKRSLAVRDVADVRSLAARADVLLVDREVLRETAGELDAASFRAVAPRLVHCTLSGFGERGPLADLPPDDGLAAAAGAISLLQWSHAGGPIYLRTPLTAYACGMAAALGAAAAVFARDAGIAPGGQAIAASQLAAGLLFQSGTYVVGPGHRGSIVQMANDPRGAIPSYGFYRASDDWLFVGALTDAFWVKLCTAIDRPDLLAHPELQVTPLAFVTPARRPIVRGALEEVFATRSRGEWLALLAEHDVPCAPVLDRREFLRDEQSRAAGMVVRVDDPVLGATEQLGVALGFSATPGAIQGPAPAFDAHAAAVRRDWAREPGARARDGAPRRPRSWSHDPDHPRERARAALPPAPLDGIRVVSLATFIAGALCPMLLADLGAEVIKLEPLDGDPFRVGTTYGFLGWNRGTRSLALDLRHPDGREVFLDLVRRADAVVENFRPGVLARLGLDTPALHAANPRLVHCSISGYGTRGPLAERPCFDPIMQARSGLVRAQGGHDPVFHQVAYTDYSTATLAAFGTVAALLARERDPARKGERVEASLLASAFVMQAGFAIDWPERPDDPPGEPALRGTGPFHRAYAVRDGWVFVAAHANEERSALLHALGLRAPSEPGTMSIADAIAAGLAGMSRSSALAELASAGVPAVACAGFPEIVDDPHLAANRLWWAGEHCELGPIVQTGEVIAFEATPMRLGPTAPRLGQHTRELLAEVGLDQARIDALVAAGVVKG